MLNNAKKNLEIARELGARRCFKLIWDRILNPALLIGFIIVKLAIFREYKIHLLSTWQDTDKRSKIDNLLFRAFFSVWIKFEYLKEPNPDKREILKLLALGGESGKNWAEHFQSTSLDLNAKKGRMTFKESNPLFEEIGTILGNTDQQYLVIQVGSSSGREIRYFASMFAIIKTMNCLSMS